MELVALCEFMLLEKICSNYLRIDFGGIQEFALPYPPVY